MDKNFKTHHDMWCKNKLFTQGVILPYPLKKRRVRYPPISEPLIYYGFDLIRWCNFKGFWLPVKQVLYINKKLNHSHALFQPLLLFSLSPFSRLLLHLPTSFARCCLSKQNPQIIDTTSAAQPTNPQSSAHPQTHRWYHICGATHKTLRARRTHKPSESGALTTSNRRRFFSSNPLVGAAL